jgi:hypothetical protein
VKSKRKGKEKGLIYNIPWECGAKCIGEIG